MPTYNVIAQLSPNEKWWVLEEPTLGAVSQVKDLHDAKKEMLEPIAYLAEIKKSEIKIELQIVSKPNGEIQ